MKTFICGTARATSANATSTSTRAISTGAAISSPSREICAMSFVASAPSWLTLGIRPTGISR